MQFFFRKTSYYGIYNVVVFRKAYENQIKNHEPPKMVLIREGQDQSIG